MLPACTASQKPYAIGSLTSDSVHAGTENETPGASCRDWAANNGSYPKSISEFQCVTLFQPDITYPVVKVCDDTPQFTLEKIQDMSALWSMFLLVFIVIIGLRKLYDIFDKAPHGE